MPPVKTVASPADVDNEATAELPVLDVAAYEATLNDAVGSTDAWTVPASGDTTVSTPLAAVDVAAIPTLQAAEPESIADLSGTHEMPQFARPNKIIKAVPSAIVPPAEEIAPAPVVSVTHSPVAQPADLPPSPPLIEELRRALATAERRIEELHERARIADAERAVAVARVTAENQQLRAQLATHLESLHRASGKRDAQRAEQSALEDEVFARGDRNDALRRELAAQSEILARVREALESSEQKRTGSEADIVNLRATLERRDIRIGVLEADLSARHQRERVLTARLEEALSLADPLAPGLRAQITARDDQIRELQKQLAAAQSLAAEKDADLQVAEESIHHLEVEVRDKAGKLTEASHTVEEWRAVIAESQRSILLRDNRILELEADIERRKTAAVDSAAQTGEEIALEGPARLLIRTDGNTDFVHVLGRRTRIGRGPDNELVLDTKHISRHHAVLLAGPVHTSIEDLNSTNGVFVNNRRVSRQVLKDGDRVTIGRSQFRYTVRS